MSGGPPIKGRRGTVEGIVVGGEVVRVPGMATIIDRRDWWDPETTRAARRREGPPRAVVWHHTGGEGDGRQIVRTLRSRASGGAPDGLSVHYTIARGVIRQHADPLSTVCLHAGRVNGWSVGVEIQCRGRAPSARKWSREEYDDQAHGRTIRYLRVYPEDMARVLELYEALSDALDLPRRWPMGAQGVSREVLPDDVLDGWRGHLGHLHLSPRKIDPTPHLMDELQAMASGA